MVGKLLADSGGADQVVDTLLRGRSGGLPWKMALIAFIIVISIMGLAMSLLLSAFS